VWLLGAALAWESCTGLGELHRIRRLHRNDTAKNIPPIVICASCYNCTGGVDSTVGILADGTALSKNYSSRVRRRNLDRPTLFLITKHKLRASSVHGIATGIGNCHRPMHDREWMNFG
jgi:hypothetical protein